MPILGHDDIVEMRREPVDDRHHFLTVCHREAPPGDEAILYIDHDQGTVDTRRDTGCGVECIGPQRQRGAETAA